MCGFSNVRRDEKGYYCEICGKRMDRTFEQRIRLTLPPQYLTQLRRQCRTSDRGEKR